MSHTFNLHWGVKSHLLGWDLSWSLGHILWCADVVRHVEVNVLATCRLVEARVLQLQRSRAEHGAEESHE